jgi:hypothetical protein
MCAPHQTVCAMCDRTHTLQRCVPVCVFVRVRACACVCVRVRACAWCVRACTRSMCLNVSCRMVLAIGIGDAGEEGSQQRQTFAACLISDLADAAGA